jgi:hypothetical protein
MGVKNPHSHTFTVLRFRVLGGGCSFVAKDCFLCFWVLCVFMDHQGLEEMMHLLMRVMLELDSTKAVVEA